MDNSKTMTVIKEQIDQRFLPINHKITEWNDIQLFYDDLAQRKINNVIEIQKWLLDRSDLEALVQEELGWRYIKQTCDIADNNKRAELNYFINEIEPKIAEYTDIFNRKLLESPFLSELSKDSNYSIYLRGIQKEAEIFRIENIPLFAEIQTLASEYGRITGSMSVEINGETLTFQQASNLLKSEDRSLRQEI